MAGPLTQNLLDFATQYEASQSVANLIFPLYRSDKRLGRYEVRSRRDAARLMNFKTGPSQRPALINPLISMVDFTVEDYSGSVRWGTEERGGVIGPLSSEEALTLQLMDAMQLEREKRASDIVTNSANYSGNTAAASATWSTTGRPLTDINAAKAALAWSNNSRLVGVCSRPVANAIVTNSQLVGSFGGQVKEDQLAAALGLSQLIIVDMQFDSANPGAASASYSRLYGSNTFALFRVPETIVSPTGTQSFGACFRYVEDANTPEDAKFPGVSLRFERTGMEGPYGTDYLIGAYSERLVVTQGDMGFLLTGCV